MITIKSLYYIIKNIIKITNNNSENIIYSFIDTDDSNNDSNYSDNNE